MEKSEIEKLIASYDAKAEKAYREYQASGVTRYDTARYKAEQMAEVLRMALNAEADHSTAVTLRCSVSEWAGKIERLPYLSEERREQTIKDILSDIAATERLQRR